MDKVSAKGKIADLPRNEDTSTVTKQPRWLLFQLNFVARPKKCVSQNLLGIFNRAACLVETDSNETRRQNSRGEINWTSRLPATVEKKRSLELQIWKRYMYVRTTGCVMCLYVCPIYRMCDVFICMSELPDVWCVYRESSRRNTEDSAQENHRSELQRNNTMIVLCRSALVNKKKR